MAPSETLGQRNLDQVTGHLPLFRGHFFHHRNERLLLGFLSDKNTADKSDPREQEHEHAVKDGAQNIQPHDIMQGPFRASVKCTGALLH